MFLRIQIKWWTFYLLLLLLAILIKMKKYQQSRRLTTQTKEKVQSNYFQPSSKQLRIRRMKTQVSPEDRYQPQSTTQLDSQNKEQKFVKNIFSIQNTIFRTYQPRQAKKNEEDAAIKWGHLLKLKTPHKKLNLLQLDELKGMSQSKSTQCQTPKGCRLINCNKVAEYKTIKILGKGRFGDVYLAMHKLTGFIGALKVIKKASLHSQTLAARSKIMKQIMSQIKIQWALTHPNLIQLYDFFYDDDHIFLFVELGSDGHLYRMLENHGPFSEETTAIIIRQVALGIQHMHEQKIIHRDIKLENVVFTHGMAKICDFGWSVYEPGDFRQTICGTPLYLSPQILKGYKYNYKIDVWALGSLTHELVIGENPFGITRRAQLENIITKDLQITVGSPQFRSFVNFLLRKSPQKRPSADVLLRHPFLVAFEGLETSEQICNLSYQKRC